MFEDLYIKENLFCSLYSLSNMSNIVHLACCRTCRTLFAQLAIKHVKHCSSIKLLSRQIIVLRITCCVVDYILHVTNLA
jgi:hypothetical protein